MRKLIKATQSGTIQTITVDIFDTVLLRKIYPEELQFLKHAKRASALLTKEWKRDISPFYFYSFRQYVRRVLVRKQYSQTNEREVSIRDIFAQALESIAQKEAVQLEQDARNTLVDLLLSEELEIEKKNLRPNRRLVSVLQRCKEKGVRIYFVSDMYLETGHIQELLQHFGIEDVFDGGISSASAGYGKGGRLFSALSEDTLFPHFTPEKNVHIGDNRRADVWAAQRLAMAAIHYRSFHTLVRRPLLRATGILRRKMQLRPQKKAIQSEIARALKEKSAPLGEKERCLFRIGFTLGPAIAQYLSFVDIWSRATGHPVYFVSREAETLCHLNKILHAKSTSRALPFVNRLSAMKQFLYLGITQADPKDPLPVLLVPRGGSYRETLNIFGLEPSDLPLPFELYEKTPSLVFLESIGNLLSQKPQLLKHIRTAHERIQEELQQTNFLGEKKIILSDIGWNGTIQSLLQFSMRFLGNDIEMEGIYLGCKYPKETKILPRGNMFGALFQHEFEKLGSEICTEEIWEYAICASEEEKHRSILRGIEYYFRLYADRIPCATEFALECSLHRLRKLFRKPNMLQASLLGSINHKPKIGSSYSQPIVESAFKRAWLIRMLLLHPSLFLKHYKKQFWPEGFLTLYKLRFFRPLLFLQLRRNAHKQVGKTVVKSPVSRQCTSP